MVVNEANDIALVAIPKHLKDAQLFSFLEINAVMAWLKFANEKTETIPVTKRHKRNYAHINGDQILESDNRREAGLQQHVYYTFGKACTAGMALARMMPNTRGHGILSSCLHQGR